MFDAYTVKKLLPRLFIAVIVMQFSWFLFTTATTLTANIAHGVEGLMYAPFGGVNNLTLANILSQSGFAGNQIFLGGVLSALPVGFFYGIFLGYAGILALIGTIFIALALAFFLLIMRRVVLIALILLSPLALVAWILPGTDKYWKLWYESFSKLNIVYVLIVIVIAGGKVMAFIAAKSGAGTAGGPAGPLVTVAAVTICFFGGDVAVPKLFQVAGSAFANLSGMVNDRSRGPLDRLRNFRSTRSQERAQKWKTGALYNDRGRVTGGLNTLGRRAGAGLGGRLGYGARGKAIMEDRSNIAATEFEKTNPLFAANKENDKVTTLLALNRNRSEAQAWIRSNTAEGSSERTIYSQALESASAIGFNNASRRASLMSGATIGYGLDAGEAGWTQATGAMKELSGMSATTSDSDAAQSQTYRNLMNQFQYVSKNVGRADLSGAVDGGEYNGYRAWSSVSLYTHGNGKPADIKGSGQYFQGLVQRVNSNSLTAMDRKNFERQAKAADISVEAAAAEAAAAFHVEQAQLAQNATGAVRDEAIFQQSAVGTALGSLRPDVVAEINPTPSTYRGGGAMSTLDRITSAEGVRRKARTYDRTDRGAGPGGPPPA